MIKTKLTLGTKLSWNYTMQTATDRTTLISQFEAVLLTAAWDTFSHIGRKDLPGPRGTNLDVIYEKNGDLYRFASQAIGRKLEGNVHLLRIKPLSEEEKIQRRYFFRFNCVRDLDYRVFADRETKEEERGDYLKGITKDISGGGICLCSDIKPEIGWYVEGKLLLNQDILFIGRVVRVINVHDRGKYIYEIGIEFVDITNMNRERIIGYIFEEQRKLLKKGWTK